MTTLNANTVKIFSDRLRENEALTYTINYAGELDTDTISTSTWLSEDTGLTIANTSNTTTTATARLSSANTGKYRATNQIVTTTGDTIERAIDLKISDNSLDTEYFMDYC